MRIGIAILIALVFCFSAKPQTFNFDPKIDPGLWPFLTWIEWGAFVTVDAPNGEQFLELQVRFRPEIEQETVEKARIELVATALLPRSHMAGHTRANYKEYTRVPLPFVPWEFRSGRWEFAVISDWQWRQVFGPEVDWSFAEDPRIRDEDRQLNIPAEFLALDMQGDQYQLVLFTEALGGLSPKESFRSAVSVLQERTKCLEAEGNRADFLTSADLESVYVFVYPEPITDRLNVMPRVYASLRRIDGEWTCASENAQTVFETTLEVLPDRWEDALPRR